MMKRLFSYPPIASLLFTSACTAVTSDIDELARAELPEYLDVTLQLRSMGIHRNEQFEARIVNDREGSNNDTLLQRVVRMPLGGDDEDIFIPAAIPRDGATRIDFYAEHNDELGYQADSTGGVDHGWSIPLTHGDPHPAEGVAVTRDAFTGHWNILFEHQFEFTVLTSVATGLDDFKVVYANWGAMGEAAITVRLKFNGRVVAAHRSLPEHPLVEASWLTDPAAVIPDIIDTTLNPDDYLVEIWVDQNQNGQYDNPAEGGDLGWRISKLSLGDTPGWGMVVNHDLTSGGGNVDVGP